MYELSSGDLARESGVTVETLRFYERKGLLRPPPRNQAGYRQYPRDAVRRVLFIKRTQELGFTLQEIRSLLGLCFPPGEGCVEMHRRITDKIREVDDRVKMLMRVKQILGSLLNQCPGQDVQGECPLVTACLNPTLPERGN